MCSVPESILTNSLIPYFESALAAEDQASRASMESSNNGPINSAPSHQRTGSSLGLRKAPSLSTLAVPNFKGKRTVSDSLLKALTWLISRMPRENRDLLYTVIELIRQTAARSVETKMPLANLLLLFSPTLNMNPGMLRVLCEHEDIWLGAPQAPPQDETPEAAVAGNEEDEDEVLDIRATFVTARESTGSVGENSATDSSAKGSSSSGVDADESTSDDDDDDEESSLHTPEESPEASHVDVEQTLGSRLTVEVGNRMAQVMPDVVLLPPINPVSPVVLADDAASFISALEPQSTSSTRSTSPHLAQDVPQLSSSESLTSRSETSEEPLSPRGRSSVDVDEEDAGPPVMNLKEQNRRSQDSFFLAPSPSDDLDLSLRAIPRRPAISTNLSVSTAQPASVTFPSVHGSTPATPISRRKSFALLSFPSLRSASESPSTSNTSSPSTSTPPSTWHRPKRPSLHLLLQKVTGGRNPSTPISTTQSAMASVPSLSSYPQSKPAAASVPSLTTTSPTDEVAHPRPSHSRTLSSIAPPKLETTISSSPIRLSFTDVTTVTSTEQDSADTTPDSTGDTKIPVLNIVTDEPSPTSSEDSPRYVRPRAGSCATSLYVTPTGTTPKTPIADLYSQHTRSKSAMSFFNATDMDVASWRTRKDDGDSLLPVSRTTSEVRRGPSPTPSIDLSVEETGEDWAASILMVAKSPVEQEV